MEKTVTPAVTPARFRSAPDRFATVVYALAAIAALIEFLALFWLDIF